MGILPSSLWHVGVVQTFTEMAFFYNQEKSGREYFGKDSAKGRESEGCWVGGKPGWGGGLLCRGIEEVGSEGWAAGQGQVPVLSGMEA